MLENIFAAVFNMSITASVAVVLIVFLRWIFNNRLPKIFNYALWAIVLLRLLIPFSLPTMFSVFNAIPAPEVIMSQNPQNQVLGNNIPYGMGPGSISQAQTFSDVIINNIKNSLPAAKPEASVDPIQVFMFSISMIWLAGTVGLFSFSIFAYFHASNRLKQAVIYKNNDLISQCSQKLKINREIQIYTSDRILTPVVCGIIKARIILPLALTQGCNELELKHIITHELVHIKRFDYILKPLSVMALCAHWFNPVIWVGFILSQKDMEMSCDEKVMSVCDVDIRSEYATSLIKLAAKQNILLNGGLLAFGESNIKSRIKEIMKFRKPGFWVGAATIIILIVISIALLTNMQIRSVNKDITNKIGVHSKQITSFASEIMNRDIDIHESNPEVNIIDSKITRLELIESFDTLADTPIDVYALEYRLLPEDLSKVVLAGGMQLDQEGWLKETSSMGSPLLVISRKVDSVELIGTLWSGGALEGGGLESSIKELLQQNLGVQSDEIEFIDALNRNVISPLVTDEIRKELESSIASMKEMGPGVGPWIITYYNEDKIILYNYAHIVACDISENNKGIYSIIELNNLKVGSYEGSAVAMISPSPDAMVCVLGTGCWESDYKTTKSLYICNFKDNSVRELETNYNMADKKVTWYRDMLSSTMLTWYVSVTGNDTTINWDVERTRKLDSLPMGSRIETVDEKYIEKLNFETGYFYNFWWEKDEDTVIGAPYKNGVTSSSELKLSDFEIIEVNRADKTTKILFKIDI